MNIEIIRLHQPSDAQWCARLMSNSEPWITLGLAYDDSLKIISDPTKEVYVATVESRLAGFVIINMQGAFIGYIQTICIAHESRGKGIGSALVAFAEERILSETPNVFLCVSSFNAEAKKLYERLGYTVIGELNDYIVTGYSEILMRKSTGPLKDFKKKGDA
jgi:[ribosomal protein S18]-alanine N-acetyltransferase